MQSAKKGKMLDFANGDRLELVRKSWMDTKRNQNQIQTKPTQVNPTNPNFKPKQQEQLQSWNHVLAKVLGARCSEIGFELLLGWGLLLSVPGASAA